ncbi:MAG TPA: DUF2807 domain-containing protein [Kofleriaceae bacterium]|nr:DUF2807 domain-containing protein [Kofleriaceae bacterium]
MKRTILPFALVLASGLASGLVPGFASGLAIAEPASVTRSVPEFHAIDLAGTLEIEVTVGKPVSCVLTGDAELFDKVITTVKSGVLVVDTRFDRDDRRGHHRVKALVTAPDLTSLSITGTGAIKAKGIANESLAISVPGTGAINASGSTGTLRVKLDGTGDFAAKDLAAKAAIVDVGGTGQATLRASESFEATISGTGSVDVHGRPARVKKTVTGVGNIHVH